MSPVYINGVEQGVAGYTDAQALAAAVQAGVIVGGVTKAPTHDAVFDVKTTADAALPASQKAAASGVASLNASSLVVQKPADRLSKANFEITLDKLLKGAGAGVDPTEIDVPTGATTFAALTDVKIVRKTADETVYNSAVLQNDDHLFMAIGANEVWVFLLYLRVTGGGLETARGNFTVPAGASYLFKGTDGIYGTTDNVQFGASSGPAISVLEGVVVNSGTAGNLQFQWAQWSAKVENTIVLTNSYIIAFRLL